MLTRTESARSVTDMAAEVREGLTRTGQKELPSKYFYDEVGSPCSRSSRSCPSMD
jgi:uncharacterized SAM-dependent methyltransferase